MHSVVYPKLYAALKRHYQVSPIAELQHQNRLQGADIVAEGDTFTIGQQSIYVYLKIFDCDFIHYILSKHN